MEAGISDGSDGTDDDIPNWRELFAEECARTRLYAGLDPPAQDDKALQEQDTGSAMLPQVAAQARPLLGHASGPIVSASPARTLRNEPSNSPPPALQQQSPMPMEVVESANESAAQVLDAAMESRDPAQLPREEPPTNLIPVKKEPPKKDEDDLQILSWISHPPPPLTEAAIDQRLRRIMKPRRNGEYVVGKDFIEMWEDKHAGGRDRVRSLFEKAAYEPDRGVFK